jgi:hypothetical protein
MMAEPRETADGSARMMTLSSRSNLRGDSRQNTSTTYVPASGIASSSPLKSLCAVGGMDRPSKLHIMRRHIYKYAYISFMFVS